MSFLTKYLIDIIVKLRANRRKFLLLVLFLFVSKGNNFLVFTRDYDRNKTLFGSRFLPNINLINSFFKYIDNNQRSIFCVVLNDFEIGAPVSSNPNNGQCFGFTKLLQQYLIIKKPIVNLCAKKP